MRVLIIANEVIGTRMAGPGIRAWEIARVLAERDGGRSFEVTLAVPPHVPMLDEAIELPFAGRLLRPDEEGLRRAAAEADAVFTQGFVLYVYPWLREVSRVLALDIYGPFVLEGLEQYAPLDSGPRWAQHETDLGALNDQLRAGDFFVCASERQRDYWLGMLTALGRINPATYDADPSVRRLVGIVPFGLPAEPLVHSQQVLKGVWPGIGSDDRVILWLGGIWNWFDPFSLIRAMPQVLERHPDARLFFLGAIHPNPSTPESVHDAARQAEALARELGLLDHSVFLSPWVSYEERLSFLCEADLMAMTYHEHIETRFAFRTRMMDAIYAGLPTVCSRGDTLADLVATHGLGRTVPAGDPQAIAAALVSLLDEPDAKAARADAFRRLAGELTWERVVEPLAEYLQVPAPAPDRVERRAEVGTPADDDASPSTPPRPVPPAPERPLRELPGRALEILRQGGPRALAAKVRHYLARRLRRPDRAVARPGPPGGAGG